MAWASAFAAILPEQFPANTDVTENGADCVTPVSVQQVQQVQLHGINQYLHLVLSICGEKHGRRAAQTL